MRFSIRNLLVLFIVLLCSSALAQIPPTGIQDEGGTETKPVFTINCVGAGISCSHSGKTATLTVAGGGGTNCFELDASSDLQPVSTACGDPLFETDGNDDIQPTS